MLKLVLDIEMYNLPLRRKYPVHCSVRWTPQTPPNPGTVLKSCELLHARDQRRHSGAYDFWLLWAATSVPLSQPLPGRQLKGKRSRTVHDVHGAESAT